MIWLLLPVAVPVVLLLAWVVVLRRRGVPGWPFFLSGGALVVVCLVFADVAGDAEDRATSYECRTGAEAGLECGLGFGRLIGGLAAVAGLGCLAFLAVVSLVLVLVRRHRERRSYRGPPALTE